MQCISFPLGSNSPKFCNWPRVILGNSSLFWLIDSILVRFAGSVAQLSSVQSLSHVRLFATPWTAACQVSLSITNSRSPPKLMPIELVMPSNHLILCRPLLLLPPIPPSIRVFSNESALCIRWPKYWSFSFNISPSNEHLGLSSIRMDWLDLIAVQGTLRSLLQHHSSKASILLHSAFFIVQNSHPYMTTGKTIALTRWTFVGKVMSLLFNMLSRLVITFLPRSKCLLISWLQSPSAVILEPRKKKATVSPSICHEVMGPDAMILVFWMLSFKRSFSLSSFIFIKRLLSSSSLSAIRVVSSAYLRLLIFLLAILIPACASSDCGSGHDLLFAKFRLKLKKVEKTTTSFRYNLNQIPYYYTVEVRNRYKGLDLIDRVPDELWTEVHDIVQEMIQYHPPKKYKKAKWLSEAALQIAVKRREVKSKGEMERYTYLNAEFQRIARRDKKAFLSDQCKEIEENNWMGRLEIYSRKLEIPREHFMQTWAQ